ncbi:enoyl-CoA hydratase-related protein [Streptomyces pacificus]|uniref:enoyl-CoA hydratase n=1 Tax=Streptomyces pacificus TaxID=2705029 RepID=A0A6A0B260_9ACTN|nr:enoyl-CoA hydratase-related protein [Streptomyces pacificus]GFH38384.1 enoyl-CoA hydratase [Streptomyces pacificus]
MNDRQYRTIRVDRDDRVVTVTLDRPAVLNALSSELMGELVDALQPLDRDPGIGSFVVTGSGRAFAAGADITEMASRTAVEMAADDYFAGWEAFAALRTPKIASVAGYALGGGCELAMMCDLVIAADTAVFGQPEVRLGVIPGIGGTQRLTRLVGAARAMDMILTGRTMDAAEAERAGLVSRTVPADRLAEETAEVARTIAAHSKPAVLAAREAVQRALETGLRDGLLFERRVFHALFANRDQKEGMQAFMEKRDPVFTGR